MKMKEQKDKESVGLIRNILNNESSFVIEAITACVIIILGIIFDIEFLEWVISFGSLALISITELINTAIEATVDMVTLEYNEYAKIAKDCASAATAVMTVLAIIVNLIIFVPYIMEMFIEVF